jgi:hypothetical protein
MSKLITIKNIPRKKKEWDNCIYDKIYTEVPEVYTDNNSWPTYCNLDCYNCTCTINSIPIFVPINVSNANIFRGSNPVVCSPNCATILCAENNLLLEYLRELCKRIKGKDIGIINPSSDKSVIKNYGGTITKEQYQEQLRANNVFFT